MNTNNTFQPIIIHAALSNNEIEINFSFDVNEKFVEQHSFTSPTLIANDVLIETSFESIDKDILLEGFITPIVPGVYIEHSHPHEPLPLFSIYKKSNTTMDDIDMSFRILRDERYVNLDTFLNNNSHHHVLYFEFQYLQSKYCIQLEFKKLKLPIQFLKEINASPKIIFKQGQFFDSNPNSHHLNYNQHQELTKSNFYNKHQESFISSLCKTWIERLNQERRLFLLNIHNKKNNQCHWVEFTGDHCNYCNFN